MKILTWNINGIRGNKGLGLKQLLDSLDADVICLQETKVSREQLDESSAVVEGYNSYFSFSRVRAGYSGVATFVRDDGTPWKAEDGLSGLASDQKGQSIGHYDDQLELTDEELMALDREGRCVITQHKIRDISKKEREIVIMNVYCPRAEIDNEDRKSFKMRFYQLLQSRAEKILKSGRHVIVLGDINTSHKKIDHCDPANDEEFYANPGRKWLDNFLCDPLLDAAATGALPDDTDAINHHRLFVDTFRFLHPDQLNAFTNWSSATGARETNYGCRLDYIFADRYLARHLFKDCFIMRDVMGSDHCPVKAVLDCSVIPAKKCPSLCTKYLPQFSGKQQKLSSFLVKAAKPGLPLAESDATENSQTSRSCNEPCGHDCFDDDLKLSSQVSQSETGAKNGENTSQEVCDIGIDISCLRDISSSNEVSLEVDCPTTETSLPLSMKRSHSDSKKGAVTKKSKIESRPVAKQSNLLNFFEKKTSEESAVDGDVTVEQKQHEDISCALSQGQSSEYSNSGSAEKDQQQAEERLSFERTDLSNSATDFVSSSGEASHSSTAFTWKNLLKGPPQAPLCKGHKEPCVLRTVKKSGPNKGKQFWTCNRPEGHKTNRDARCDYFVWVSQKK